ncbi:hypothetical protein EV361DRAFT_136450 [Lentinula raphanica]|nr:hypothetical protein EV361DRAFT_136450 [Lentinula raphanica]
MVFTVSLILLIILIFSWKDSLFLLRVLRPMPILEGALLQVIRSQHPDIAPLYRLPILLFLFFRLVFYLHLFVLESRHSPLLEAPCNDGWHWHPLHDQFISFGQYYASWFWFFGESDEQCRWLGITGFGCIKFAFRTNGRCPWIQLRYRIHCPRFAEEVRTLVK